MVVVDSLGHRVIQDSVAGVATVVFLGLLGIQVSAVRPVTRVLVGRRAIRDLARSVVTQDLRESPATVVTVDFPQSLGILAIQARESVAIRVIQAWTAQPWPVVTVATPESAAIRASRVQTPARPATVDSQAVLDIPATQVQASVATVVPGCQGTPGSREGRATPVFQVLESQVTRDSVLSPATAVSAVVVDREMSR